MGYHIAAWFLLAGLFATWLPQPFAIPKDLGKASDLNKFTINKLVNWIRFTYWAIFIALVFQSIVLWQGLHLLLSGYECPLYLDYSVLSGLRAKSQFLGLIIVTVCNYFPYLIIGGYTVLASQQYHWWALAKDRLLYLKPLQRFLNECSELERKCLGRYVIKVQISLNQKSQKELDTDAVYHASETIKHIQEGKVFGKWAPFSDHEKELLMKRIRSL